MSVLGKPSDETGRCDFGRRWKRVLRCGFFGGIESHLIRARDCVFDPKFPKTEYTRGGEKIALGLLFPHNGTKNMFLRD